MPTAADDFDRGDTTAGLGTSSSGHLWTPRPSLFYGGAGTTGSTTLPLGIASNAAYTPEAPAASAKHRMETLDIGAADLDFATVVLNSVSGSSSSASINSRTEQNGLLLRWVDQDNFWLVTIYTSNSSPFRDFYFVEKWVAGVRTVAHSGELNGNVGPSYRIEAEVHGDSWDILYTDLGTGGATTPLAFTDATHQAGTKHGLFSGPGVSGQANVRMDDFQIDWSDARRPVLIYSG